jgi:integrase
VKEELPKPAWGAIDRLPSGRIRLRGPIEGKRETVGTYAKVEEALGAALEMKRRLGGAPRGLTVSGWGRAWCERREKIHLADPRKHRSVYDTIGLWDRYLHDEPIGKKLLRELRTKHVAQWLDALAQRQTADGTPLGRSTLRNALGALTVALRDAVIAGHIDGNPSIGVVLPAREARTEDEWTFLSADEIRALLEHAALAADEPGRRARLVFTLAIYTGVRQGELWGLRWEDIDLDAGQMIVRYGNGAGGPTKSGRPRTVPLLPPAREALRALQELEKTPKIGGHVFLGRKRGGPPAPYAKKYDGGWAGSWHRPRYADGKPVQVGPDGKRPKVWRDGWRELCGVRAAVTFHDLRHTFASHLIMGTWGRAWRLEEVQIVLGHTSITTTQRYAHLAPEGMRRTVLEAEQMWRDPTPTEVTSRVTPIRPNQKT